MMLMHDFIIFISTIAYPIVFYQIMTVNFGFGILEKANKKKFYQA